jgi:hypothetical protein
MAILRSSSCVGGAVGAAGNIGVAGTEPAWLAATAEASGNARSVRNPRVTECRSKSAVEGVIIRQRRVSLHRKLQM